ncbi:MAG: biotin/lipoyl-binding protein [Firmicutes bacterium]|nr:biotin/lipoyl-binding protein [Bacillota bacterium]
MRKFKVTVEGQTYDVSVEEISEQGTATTPAVAGRTQAAPAAVEKTVKSAPVTAPPAQPVEEAAPVGGDGTAVPAPMPGSVIEVTVKPGDQVAEGDVLLILEAMKMENEITSPVGGTVTKVTVTGGDSVNTGDALVYIA